MVSACLVAASSVGTVTSAEPFLLSGTRVPVAGIPNWPVLEGDEVVMARSPGLMIFRDGTQVYLLPNSRIKISAAGERTLVRLEEGGLAYKFSKNSRVNLSALANKALPDTSGRGRLMVSDGEAQWSPADPSYFRAAGVVRTQDGRYSSGQYRLTPLSLESAGQGQGQGPPWWEPPGFEPPGPPGPVPPGPILRPPVLPPVSPWKEKKPRP